jgi:iron complex outermembrane receptor protein
MKKLTATALLLSTAFSTTAYANDGDIIVTARKTEERLNEVPVSVRYLDEEEIKSRNAIKVTDLPGFGNRISSINSNAMLLSLHGQQQSDPHISADGAVATYVDGVYVARSYGLNTTLLDVKDVQILYGPQGTLFGRNTTGGALLINSNDPKLNETSVSADFTYGRFNELQETGVVNLPLSNSVAVRFAATKLDRDGYITDTATGIKWNDKDEFQGRAKILYSPSTDLRVVLTGEYFDSSAYSDARQRTSTAGVADVAVPANVVSQSYNIPSTINYGGITGSVEYGNLKVVGGWRKTKSSQLVDLDGGAADLSTVGNDVDIQQYTAEATYRNTLGNAEYILGAFVFDERGTDNLLTSANSRSSNINYGYDGVNKSYGTFVNINYPIGNLNVNAGIRYTHDSKTAITNNFFVNSALVPTGCIFPNTSLVSKCRIDLASKFDNVSWNAGVDYNLDDNNMLYAKVATGYRAGGVNKASETSFLAKFEPEKVIEYTVGAKGKQGPLTYSISVFYSDVTDGQTSSIFFIPTAISILKNAAKVRTYGGEASVSLQVSDNFKLRAAGMLAKPKYLSYIDPANGRDLTNSRFNMLLEEQFTLDGTYTLGKATLNANYQWSGKMPHTTLSYADILTAFAGNTAKANLVYGLSQSPSTGTLNLRASYPVTSNVDVSVWGRNVLNERYFRWNFVRSSFFTTGSTADPVTYGLTVSAKF